MNAPQQPAPQKQSAATAWTLLLIAAAIEVVFALSSGANGGFTKIVPSIITVVAGGGGVYILSLALKSIDVGIGYTVWTGIGAVGSVLLAAVLYGEEITLGKVFCFLAIIGGVIGLHLTSEAPEDEPVVDGSSEPEVEPVSHPSAQAAGPPPLSGGGPNYF
ncbi:quaternary ammonium compound-resistance protein SugE [Streptomyces sp. 2224.1]|uniref:DMT family transporter n=1 Tax=Streptomyces sp. 2224.1 TaxID=1881020 RepID=UPI0008959BD6|nr:multidrug efflux SMR transporter [Streptomyces sp. 2224.1]SEE15090.1 quaternary ammonium compound-resistance protein SugE [Streptomyces sp. 2224.1]